jgi:hypothetical protein
MKNTYKNDGKRQCPRCRKRVLISYSYKVFYRHKIPSGHKWCVMSEKPFTKE